MAIRNTAGIAGVSGTTVGIMATGAGTGALLMRMAGMAMPDLLASVVATQAVATVLAVIASGLDDPSSPGHGQPLSPKPLWLAD